MTSPLAGPDFDLIRGYLAETAGLVFEENRRAGLSAVLAERMASAGTPDVSVYVDLLRAGGTNPESVGGRERQRLLDSVTVQETCFFRNPPQMAALRTWVLPELVRACAGRERPLTVWSAGCSTGEEPYTLAMLLLELAGSSGSTAAALATVAAVSRARVVGTDVSEEALRAAREATYSGRTLAATPPGSRVRWFEPRPGERVGVRPEASRLVELTRHNLVTEPPPFDRGEVDLIVCRNVTIYFSRETTRALIGRFAGVLAPGGYLLLGHSETLWRVSEDFALVPMGDAFLYRSVAGTRGDTAARMVVTLPPPRTGRAVPVERRPARAMAAGPVGSMGTAGNPNPGSAATLLLEARAALTSGDYSGAVEVAGRATAIDSLLTAAYVVLGQAAATLGRDVEAVDALRKAVFLDPTAGDAHFLLAGSLARLGQGGAAGVSYLAAARSLSGLDGAVLDPLLGGRDVGELVELCQRLAGAARGRAPISTAASTDRPSDKPSDKPTDKHRRRKRWVGM